ncbi:hypothetical protein M3Y99_01822200 [Aphelenchoides fujianensis]|nr:hypothetical protein M3Y99_01822200 [Aphelenchoides fujianensis]
MVDDKKSLKTGKVISTGVSVEQALRVALAARLPIRQDAQGFFVEGASNSAFRLPPVHAHDHRGHSIPELLHSSSRESFPCGSSLRSSFSCSCCWRRKDGGLHVLLFTVLWTVMLCLGLGFCVLIRKYLVHALHLVVRDANEKSMKHNILVGVQDRGQLSCHKVVLVIIYYNFDDCIADVKKLIRVNKANQPTKREMPAEEELEAQAREILLNHAQENKLVFPTRPSEGVSEFRPKHCSSSICICQFIEKKVFHSLPLS